MEAPRQREQEKGHMKRGRQRQAPLMLRGRSVQTSEDVSEETEEVVMEEEADLEIKIAQMKVSNSSNNRRHRRRQLLLLTEQKVELLHQLHHKKKKIFFFPKMLNFVLCTITSYLLYKLLFIPRHRVCHTIKAVLRVLSIVSIN